MDPIAEKMLSFKWEYARQDKNALQDLEMRISEKARVHKENCINYSDLVQGISFCLPTVLSGVPFQIDTRNWWDIERRILGNFLGYISVQSYTKHHFFASCFAVSKQTMMPSEFFYEFMREIGAFTSEDEKLKMKFWNEQCEKAHDFYRMNRTVL